ncbi:MAG: hypothetical protein HRU15_09585 [Planctomycetes bacterium]|nr:hypothetical protein [Planctomycetota bacterium]
MTDTTQLKSETVAETVPDTVPDTVLAMPSCFSDHMVVQHGKAIQLWGNADAQAEVRVAFQGQEKTAQADDNGKWNIQLDACAIDNSGSDVVVSCQDQEIKFHDVLVGSVWLCSGQSNMVFKLATAEHGKEDAAQADLPQIRYMQVTNDRSHREESDFLASGWQPLQANNAEALSAVAFYFARQMHTDHQMPIGIIDIAWGGSAGECWLSHDAMQENPVCRENLASFANDEQAVLADYKNQVDAFREKHQEKLHDDPAELGYSEQWYAQDFEQSAWKSCQRPGVKLAEQLEGNGIVWYRSDFDLPAEWQNCQCSIDLGRLDAQRHIWVDEQELEHTTWDTPNFWLRSIQGNICTGKNLSIVIRACFQFAAGNAYGDARRICLRKETGESLIIDDWCYRTECSYPAIRQGDMEKDGSIPWPIGEISWGLAEPCTMFNALIAPLIPYSLAGVLWYQGESNAGRAEQYKDILSALITSWRKHWQDDFAFGIVQLTSYTETPETPQDHSWPVIRSAQHWASKNFHDCGTVCTLDLGEADDVHPIRKRQIGERLAQWVSSTMYGDEKEWQAPQIATVTKTAQGLEVSCDHVVGALQSSDNKKIRAFAVADASGQFHWAEAEITSANTLQVKCDATSTALRYAWSDNPDVNLVDDRGIPVIEFQQP